MDDVNSIYKDNGFANRTQYLTHLAQDYGDDVWMVADLLGESEDFDGLPAMLEDGMCE